MKLLDISPLPLSGCSTVQFQRFGDSRGYFLELYRESDIRQSVPGFSEFSCKQVMESSSSYGVLRGLHLQYNKPMRKFVRCIKGRLVDFLCDVRVGSPTFGCIIGRELVCNGSIDQTTGKPRNANAEDQDLESSQPEWMVIPDGIAHGFIVLSEDEPAVLQYVCDEQHCPNGEASINFFDVDIDWKLCEPRIRDLVEPLLVKGGEQRSERDKKGMSLKEWMESEGGKMCSIVNFGEGESGMSVVG